jgi:hypothetical protein
MMKITRRQLRELIQEQAPSKTIMEATGVTKMYDDMLTHIIKNMLDDKQIAELKEWYINYTIEKTKSELSRDQVDDLRRMADELLSNLTNK